MATIIPVRHLATLAGASSLRTDVPNTQVATSSAGMPHADTFLLNRIPCPGVAFLKSCTAKYGWDIRKGYALSGATVVQTGAELSAPVFDVRLWTADHWQLWKIFASTLLKKGAIVPAGQTESLALVISHPVLNAPPHLLSEVVVDSVSAAVQDDDGVWHIEVTFLEFRAPKPVLAARPDAQFASGQRSTTTTALGNVQAETKGLLGRLSNLAAGGQ